MKQIKFLTVLTSILLGLSWSQPVLADDTSSGSSDDQQVVTTQENTAESAQSSNEPNNNSQADSTQKNTNQATDQNNQANNQNQTQPDETNKTDGWKTENGHKTYVKSDKKLKGLHQINSSWYLFDKNGYLLTGLRKIPHTKGYGYFNNKGQRLFSNYKTAKAYYWINRKGKVEGIKNYAKVISQLPEMPTGCEITAVTMMLNFAGVKVNKHQAAAIMPRSSNPNKGFIGDPYKEYPLGYWVAPSGVKPVVKHYLGTAKIMTGYSLSAIRSQLLKSHLVVVWVGAFDAFSNHALTLTGYHGSRLYYNDPWTGKKSSMSEVTFRAHWSLDAYRALSY